MPLMALSAPPRRKWRCWHFFASSLAFHAVLLGLGELDFRQEREMRFFSPENAISVSLVASGAKLESVEKSTVDTQSLEEGVAKVVEHVSPPTILPRREPRKKSVPPKKTKPAPNVEPTKAQSSPAEGESALRKDAPVASHGAAVERTIGQGEAPSFARFVPPEYPHQARARNIEGRVLLRVLVSAEGRAREIEVVETSHPMFTSAARRSVQRSRYVPLMHQGCAEEAWVLIPFQFKLK